MGIHITFDFPDADMARAQMMAFLGGLPTVGDARTTHDPRQAEMFPASPEPRPALDAVVQTMEKAEKPKRAQRGGAKVTDVVEQPPAISTGEERSEVQATVADKPTEPAKVEKVLLTVDDVRAAAKPYIDKFTMAAASQDLTPCLIAATGCKAISELADKDQDVLQKAIDAFMAAGQSDKRYGAVA